MQIYIVTIIKWYKCMSSDALKSQTLFFNKYKIKFIKGSLYSLVRNLIFYNFFYFFAITWMVAEF